MLPRGIPQVVVVRGLERGALTRVLFVARMSSQATYYCAVIGCEGGKENERYVYIVS